MFSTIWISLLASSLGFTAGSVFLKRFADQGAIGDLTVSFLVFAISNLIYAQVLARGLGQSVVLSSMTQIIVMSGLGALLFGERLTPQQIGGLVLAVLSIWLICGATGAKPGAE
ncbi:MAG: hypothetical protein GY807_16445 [Gammaproteobacteria bacterium]|nr:hypothetical protein [Gammaproteobacteria bacterium]